MTTPTTRLSLAQLHAQLREITDAQRAHVRAYPRFPDGATVADQLAAQAEHAEGYAVLAERHRDVWSEIAVAIYAPPGAKGVDSAADAALIGEVPDVLLLRAAVTELSRHVAVEAHKARRNADGAAVAALRVQEPTA